MDHPVGSIEHTIQQALTKLGFPNPVVWGQTFLLRKRQLVGRRFCFEGMEAVWVSREQQIKIFGEGGELLRVLDVEQRAGSKAA